MGVKNLSRTIRKVVKTTHLSKFTGKTVAIDAMNFMYKVFIPRKESRSGKDTWRSRFETFCLQMKKFNIDPVFVFDADSPLPEKKDEESRRKIQKAQRRKNVRLDLEALRIYFEDGVITNRLIHKVNSMFSTNFSGDTVKNDMLIKYLLKVWRRIMQNRDYLFIITSERISEFRELLFKSRYLIVDAEGEGEQYAAYLWRQGIVDIVMSDDSDLVLYNIGAVIHNFQIGNDKVNLYSSSNVRRSLRIKTPESMLVYALKCGTDFSPRPQISHYFKGRNYKNFVYKWIESYPYDRDGQSKLKDKFESAIRLLSYKFENVTMDAYDKAICYYGICCPPHPTRDRKTQRDVDRNTRQEWIITAAMIEQLISKL